MEWQAVATLDVGSSWITTKIVLLPHCDNSWHPPPNFSRPPLQNRARAQPCIAGPRHNRWEALKFPSTNARSASSYLHSSSDTTVLIGMADSNKRKAGKDAAGGAAFKKKKVSHWVDWPSRGPLVQDSTLCLTMIALGHLRPDVP